MALAYCISVTSFSHPLLSVLEYEAMRVDVLTLFPEMFESPLGSAIFKRASDRGLVNIVVHNIRDYTHDRHHSVDDYPYGGGAGMVLMPGPIFEAVVHVKLS